MNNIIISNSNDIEFNFPIKGFCLDADNSSVYVLSDDFKLSKTNDSEVIELGSIESSLKAQGCPISENESLRAMEYIVQTSSVLLVLKSGLILQARVPHDSFNVVQIHPKTSKISSAKLSPDQQLLTVALQDHNVLMLSIDGHKLYSINALECNDSLHKPVGVGWGSKETQFFGLDGRPAREQKQDQVIELSPERLSEVEKIKSNPKFQKFRETKELETIIDWRGDGQFLATLTYISESDRHILKIWNRNMELQYMSEKLISLERGILNWVPNGQYVCCAQRRDDTINEIIMFEKNGLVHQRFTLPRMLDKLFIREVTWSNNSKTLALVVNQFSLRDGQIVNRPILFLYTVMNFHYYLKFSMYLDQNCEHYLRWDPNDHNKLHLISSLGHYRYFNLSFEISYSEGFSTVGLVDANQFMLTPMRICSIPPPMAAITIEFDHLIYNFCQDLKNPNNLLIVTMDSQVIHLSPEKAIMSPTRMNSRILLECQTAKILKEGFVSEMVTTIDRINNYQHFTLIDTHQLIATEYDGSTSKIVTLNLANGESKFEMLSVFPNSKIICLRPIYHGEKAVSVIVITKLGSSFIISLSDGSILKNCDIFHLNDVQGLSFAEAFRHQSKDFLISLSQDQTLRLNQRVLISNSCTSVRLTSHYMIYTLNDSTIHFVLLEHLLKDHGADVITESWSQPIENGATLVVVCEEDSKVILQMPRGNIEILHPRVLVLFSIIQLLNKMKLVDATKTARRHRVNLNFIYDYIIRQNDESDTLYLLVKDLCEVDASLMTLVITELNSEDTVSTQYSYILSHVPGLISHLNSAFKRPEITKVQHIYLCLDKLVEDSTSSSSVVCQVLKPRILCLLRRNQVREALKLVHTLDEKQQTEVLKFILYFVNIDKLFNEALRTYSTKIAIMVAAVSNKDPKNYLSLLSSFDQITEPHLRCYEIDMHVEDYNSAFQSIFRQYMVDQNNDDAKHKLLQLLEAKRLYRLAVQVIADWSPQDDLCFLVWSKYAGYLLEKRYYPEAGLAYSKALEFKPSEKTYNSAVSCFVLGDDWEKSLALYKKSKQCDLKVQQDSILGLAKNLTSRGLCLEALALMGGLAESAFKQKFLVVDLLNQSNWWLADALNLTPSIKDDIKKSISSTCEQLTKELDAEYGETNSQYERLKHLISTYQTRKLDLHLTERQYISDTLSTVDGSELSSNHSSSSAQSRSGQSNSHSLKTRNSSSSSKSQNSRAKRINLNPGSKHEDLALVLELKKFVNRQKDNQARAARTVAAAFEYENFRTAREIQEKLRDGLVRNFDLAREIYNTLWPINPSVDQQYSLYRRFSDTLTSNEAAYEDVDFQVLIRPEIPKEVRFFEL